ANLPLDARVDKLMTNPGVRKITWDLKNAIHGLRRRGLAIVPPFDDPMLMTLLLTPNRGKYDLPDVVFELFGQTIESERTPAWTVWTQKIYDHFHSNVESEVPQAYHEIELPLAPVLVDMEREGIRIDSGAF